MSDVNLKFSINLFEVVINIGNGRHMSLFPAEKSVTIGGIRQYKVVVPYFRFWPREKFEFYYFYFFFMKKSAA